MVQMHDRSFGVTGRTVLGVGSGRFPVKLPVRSGFPVSKHDYTVKLFRSGLVIKSSQLKQTSGQLGTATILVGYSSLVFYRPLFVIYVTATGSSNNECVR